MSARHRFVTEVEVASLAASIYRGFVDEKLQPCEGEWRCPYNRECWRRWYLYRTGEVRPFIPTLDYPIERRPDVQATWPRCPRLLLEDRIVIGGESCSPVAWARWQFERGAHRSDRLCARAAHLLRVYLELREAPGKLAEHIALEKAKANRPKG